MNRLLQSLWIKVFWAAARRLPWQKRKVVGARTVTELSTENTQVALTVWNLDYAKYAVSYSREELIDMLALVRRCEREMAWKVPEPE